MPVTKSLCVFRHWGFRAIVVAMFCTFFEVFNIPVFWPILVMYFLILFCVTMKRQIRVSTILIIGVVMNAPTCIKWPLLGLAADSNLAKG